MLEAGAVRSCVLILAAQTTDCSHRHTKPLKELSEPHLSFLNWACDLELAALNGLNTAARMILTTEEKTCRGGGSNRVQI